MPIHLVPYLLSSGTSISIVHPNLVAGIVFVLAVLVLRRWSNGKDLITRLYLREQELEEQRQKLNKGKPVEFTRRREVERDLHGLTFLVVCTFTPSSLLLLSALSNRGAQLILLLPSTAFAPASLPSTLQYLQLLRDGTNNQLLFAEECDLFSYTSIEGFVKRWNEGEGGGGTGVGPAGGRAASGIGMSGNEDGAASGGGTSRAPRRCDGIVFLPYTVRQMKQSGKEDSLQGTDQLKDLSKRELLGRFHLINSLLSTLLLLPPERDIRILQWVSPWYSAGLQKFCDEERTDSSDGNTLKRTASQSPTISSYGSATLSSLLLFHELQRRLILLAEADPRPRNPLPGIISPDDDSPKLSSVDDDDSKQRRAHLPNVNVVNICPGFERDGEVWQWLWPVMPSPQTSTFLQRFAIHLRRCGMILVWPLLMVIAKSPKMAVDQFIWGLVAPLDVKGGCERLLIESTLPPLEDEDLDQKSSKTAAQDVKSTFGANTTKSASAAFVGSGSIRLPQMTLPPPEEDETGWKGIQPARLYREGKIVHIAPTIVRSTQGTAMKSSSWWLESSLTKRWLRWEQSVEQWRGGSVRRAGEKKEL